jgi:hypothetical protein
MLEVTGRHPSVVHFAHHFDHDHLPPNLASVSSPFHDLAQDLVDRLPDDPELSSALRKLWDAKNSAVMVAVNHHDKPLGSRRPRRGITVDYTLSTEDAAAINAKRDTARAYHREQPREADGKQVHNGNWVTAGDVYPMVITRPWGDKPDSAVNGQVLLDGTDAHWVTSVQQGDGERHWR